MHQRLWIAYNHTCIREFGIPSWYEYILAGDAEGLAHRFPQGYEVGDILLTERIIPLPKSVQNFLIKELCPDVWASPGAACPCNNDLLVLPYLGRRLGSGDNSTVLSPHEFRLHLDQMESLGLPIKAYSERMAIALAFMHWAAHIDAGGVEFALAPTRGRVTPINLPTKLESHGLWALNFGCCEHMSTDMNGVNQAARAFWSSAPFYPRPGKRDEKDKQLWENFKRAYLEASFCFIKRGDVSVGCLPQAVMSAIEAMAPSQDDCGSEPVQVAESL
ncbi:hypothetical protein SAMD00023353_1501910 [Rosellinia necatrix]|uniref:DUF3669 domain-containing protein n=1 Tax=Rosellinia necatrix TaxID=77044 RepID=A0A1W2TRH5_ROSNE|nr:hypothetical protein SAMD00023353_1501910 [Rosellinia necatrix]